MSYKKIVIKVFFVFLLVLILLCSYKVNVEAFSLQGIFDKAKNFELVGLPGANDILPENIIEDLIVPIGQVLVTIASFVLIIVTIIMAIKYLTVGPEQRGKLKQQLIGLVVSIVVIYGAVGIWSIIKSIMEISNL